MAFGSITNRIVYLILNGQSAPRNFNTRFVKPVDTVRNIVSVVLKDADKLNGQILNQYALYTYQTFNETPSIGSLYYEQYADAGNGLLLGLGVGTEVFTNIEFSIPAQDGDYTSLTNGNITVLAGVVTEFAPPALNAP